MRLIARLLPALLLASLASAEGSFDMRWHEGEAQCSPAASGRIEAHAYDADTVVIRENLCVDFEAPLLYLLRGASRALLIDTGATEDAVTNAQLVEMVQSHSRGTDGAQLPLTIVHTHRHSDHRAGDAAFAKLPGVSIAPIDSAGVRRFLKLTDWPNGAATIDLGDRVVDVIPAPGHHEDHVVFYDRRTHLLFTGDFLLPGRLLVDDIGAYEASARRVADFVMKNPVSHVFGAHIELDQAGELYPHGVTHHPAERALALRADDVKALPAALAGFNGFYARHPNYVVEHPVHNLVALASGVLVALVLMVWFARRLWKRRRAASGKPSG
jgi:hydroxyacylglutathione hydrolase